MGEVYNIDRSDIAQAMRTYWRHAWPADAGACPALPDWSGKNMEQILSTFIDESNENEHSCHRYVLRLGNHLYPHMKFAVEQCICNGDYYFLADAHDDALPQSVDDTDAWTALRSRNYEIKLAIESAWRAEGLPTFLTASETATGTFKKPSLNSIRVLVVDDEPANAALTGAMLRAQGYGIESAGSGNEALERTNEQRPDLIVSDYEMPGMTGRDVAQRIKDNEETREIPVLICTYADVSEADLQPADALLRRPFSQEDLQVTVRRLLRKRKTG